MPRVSEKYYDEKKNKIMDTTLELIREVPLYQLTMSDVIKKLGCSQGMIYRYYQGIDEIYVCLMNREIRDIEFRSKIDDIIESQRTHREILSSLFSELGKYLLLVMDRVGGKILYELQVRYAFDKEKQEIWLPKLLFKQNFMYFQKVCVEYLLAGVEKGIYRTKIPVKDLVLYVGVSIDGILNYVALTENENREIVKEETFVLLQTLSNYVYQNIE